jgi:hypothetical protein
VKNLKLFILTEPGGARFPTILSLQYYGAPTAAAYALGLVGNDGNLVPGAETAVLKETRALVLAGELAIRDAYGYSWIVSPDSMPVRPAAEVRDIFRTKGYLRDDAEDEGARGVESTATTFRSSRTHFEDLISQFVLGPDGDI